MGKTKKAMLATGVAVVILVASGASSYLSQKGVRTVKLFSGKASAISSKSTNRPAPPLPTVTADMNQAINNDPDIQAAATLIDLDNNQTYNAGESSYVFQAASTAKLVAVIDYLHEVEQGQASLNQEIGGTTAQQELKLMIELSDNAAWANINAFLGDQQQTYADSIGLSSFTATADNKITSSDEAKLLEQLYEGKLIDSSDRALLYSYMDHTDNDSLIPAALPSDATVYNKYGQLDGELHDAAIISYQGHHFVLVIFTKYPDEDNDDYTDQTTLIHTITQAAFKDITAS